MNKNLINLITVSISLSLILIFQISSIPQIITGIIVNSVFIFLLNYRDLKTAFLLCIISPAGAFMFGILPPPMFPVIPAIISGNIIIIFTYYKLRNSNFLLRFTIPALFKAITIFILSYIIITSLNIQMPKKFILTTFSLIQIPTAIGGLITGDLIFTRIKKSLKK